MAFQQNNTHQGHRVKAQTGFILSSKLETHSSAKHVNHTKTCYTNTPTTASLAHRQSFPAKFPRNKDNTSGNLLNSSSTSNITKASNGTGNGSVSTGATVSNSNVTFSKTSPKNEALLDRKAFISLEKSINWQTLIDTYVLQTGHTHSLTSGNLPSLSAVLSQDKTTVVTQAQEFSSPGMKDVPAWLKLLRLHKYSSLFAHMSYEQMLDLSENELENRKITKGARQKLILSIQKLKVRSHVLLASELDLIDLKSGGYRKWISLSAISQVFCQIRAFLSTPICPPPPPSPSSSVSHPSLNVDANNNPSTSVHVNSNKSQTHSITISTTTLCELWLELHNEQFVDILTRMVGHLCHNLVSKCKKRLQNQNLWMKHFNEYYVTFEREQFLKKIVSNLLSLKVDKSKVMLSSLSKSEEDDDDYDESSDSSSSPHSTDSGVEAGDSGDDQRHYDGESYTCEKEETFYSELQMILDKCLEHDAFGLHSALFGEWHSQLTIMRSSLRNQLEQQTMSQPIEQTVSVNTSFVKTTPKNGNFVQQQQQQHQHQHQHQQQNQQQQQQQHHLQQQQQNSQEAIQLGSKTIQSNQIVSSQSHANAHSKNHHSYQKSQQEVVFSLAVNTSKFHSTQSTQQSHWPVNYCNLNAGHSYTILPQFSVVNANLSHNNGVNTSSSSSKRNNYSTQSIKSNLISFNLTTNDSLNVFNPQWNSWIENASTLEMNETSVWSPLSGHHVSEGTEWSQHCTSTVQSSTITSPELYHSGQIFHQSQSSTMATDSDIERLCIKMAEDALNGTSFEDK